MNNHFLLNEALDTTSVAQLEVGITNLNSINDHRNNGIDRFMKHESIYTYHNGHGTLVDFFYSIVSEEIQRLVPIVFETLSNSEQYISSENQFDQLFPNECNAFLGIDFHKTTIPANRQVTDSVSFLAFRNSCLQAWANAYTTVEEFWNSKAVLFPNLVFCDEVLAQIGHLSIDDERFKLIRDKLQKLNTFTNQWNTGVFDFKSCGLNCSPDTPKRIADTIQQRTFSCPGLGNRVFSLHAKWYFGSEPFRMYFYPEASNFRVYIGYIGDKAGIGF